MRVRRDNQTEPLWLVAGRIGVREESVSDPPCKKQRRLIVCLSDVNDDKPRNAMWFDDKPLATKQTEYLTRLRQLRSQLIDQETENLSHALARFSTREDKPSKPRMIWPPKRLDRDPVKDAHFIAGKGELWTEAPKRHLQLMEEKRLRLKRLRRKPETPHLEAVEGKRVSVLESEFRESPATESDTTKSTPREHLPPILRRSQNRNLPKSVIRESQTKPNTNHLIVKTLLRDSEKDRWRPKQTAHMGITGLVNGRKDEITLTAGYMHYIWRKHENALKDNILAPAPTPLPEDFTLTSVPFTRPAESPPSVESLIPQSASWSESLSTDSVHLPAIVTPISNPSEKKKYLVVQMPRILCQPATPDVTIEPDNSDIEPWHRSRSLIRVMQNHNLRECEVQHLLQDVRDINQINATS